MLDNRNPIAYGGTIVACRIDWLMHQIQYSTLRGVLGNRPIYLWDLVTLMLALADLARVFRSDSP